MAVYTVPETARRPEEDGKRTSGRLVRWCV
jgi:hypothetical protein